MTTLSLPVRRHLASAAGIALLAALATGCGSGGSGGSDDSHSSDRGDAITDSQAEDALLTVDDMPSGWTVDESAADDDSDGPGCIGEIGKLTDSIDDQRVVKKETDLQAPDELPEVSSEVSSYRDSSALADVFSQVKQKLTSCKQITGDLGGSQVDLTLDSDLSTVPQGADDAISYTAQGKLTTASGQSSPMYIYSQMSLVDSTVVTISVVSLSDATDLYHEYAQKGLTKALAAISE